MCNAVSFRPSRQILLHPDLSHLLQNGVGIYLRGFQPPPPSPKPAPTTATTSKTPFTAKATTAPQDGVYTLDDTAKACGRELWQRELRSLKHARETNAWQSTYSSDIRTLSLPVWAITA